MIPALRRLRATIRDGESSILNHYHKQDLSCIQISRMKFIPILPDSVTWDPPY